MSDYEDRFWTSRDGVKLHFRDYAGPSSSEGKPPVLCLHGLTRNARDFELLAPRLAAGRRVICPDMRGRGGSEYAREAASYNPAQYCEDLLALLEEEEISRFVAIGTSLGGLMTMSLALSIPERIVAAVLNDVGPELDSKGLRRILDNVGQGRNFPTWVHAARALENMQAGAHPGQPLDFWIGKAKRMMALASNGRIVFDYDMKIAEPLREFNAAGRVDLWPAWQALAGRPLLVLRGALSDLLTAETLRRMLDRVPGAEAVTLPHVGHAPTLDEPEAVAAIERLLARAA
jgi:pimeloyl-ACP methyl ester carboxylesterase